MEQNTKEIEEITFGIYSEEELLKMSVCEINNPKLCNSEKGNTYGTVYDPRLGTIENGRLCATCDSSLWQCTGHFGHIKLNEPIIHPLFYKQVVSFLKCFCTKCYKLLITEDQILLNSFNRYRGIKKFNKILEKLDKIDMCIHCSHPQPDIKYTSSDNLISMVYKDKDAGKISIVLQVHEIKKIFDNISIKDVTLLGFNPDLMQPKNLIITVFPVIPIAARPYVSTDGNICDDDLTIQLVEIIKANNHLSPTEEINETKKQKHLQSLKFRIATFYNNSCLAPDTPVLLWNGKTKRADEIKVMDKLVGDDGLVRNVIYVCSGQDDMFEVIQEDGETYVVNKEHYLTLRFPEHKKIKFDENGFFEIKWFSNNKKKIESKIFYCEKTKKHAFELVQEFARLIDDNNIFDIKVKDYIKFSDEMKSSFYGLKLNTTIQWENKRASIDPYLLGLWLADDNENGLGFTTNKPYVMSYWKLWVDTHYSKIEENPNFLKSGTDKFLIIGDSLQNSLNSYQLLKNKHIPDDYLYTDNITRMHLLSGIIDVCGCSYNKKYISITFGEKKERLLKDINFLAQSLGYKTKLKEVFRTLNNQEYRGYKLNISGNINEIPLRIPLTLLDSENETRIKINYLGKNSYNGFHIDGNNRFVLGDFTVTHNSGKAKHSTSSRAIKGIKERLTGKEGLIRTNLLGKRCDQSGRTVIGPDPTLKMGQLAVPPQMASNLTIPVQVTNFNYHFLSQLVNDGKVNYVLKNNGETRINLENALFYKGTPLNHGDVIIRDGKEIIVNNGKEMLQKGDQLKRNGVLLSDVKYPEKRFYKLSIGDVCERQLMDGDIVLLNRQPTLHEGSMMAQEVVIRTGKTLRFNLSINKSFNADFDGDEMNIHVPCSTESEAELRLLSASKYKIISAQNSKPSMCIVQDSLLGAYIMTLHNTPIKKEQFFNIALSSGISLEKITKKMNMIRKVMKAKGKKAQCFHGKGLVSLILPNDLIYEKKNNINPDEPIVKIYRGVLYEGTLDKNTLGSVHNSLIHRIHKEFGPDETTIFIDGIQFITNNWLLHHSFSVGLGDCMVSGEDKVQEINDVISKCYIEAEGIKSTTHNPIIREVRITGALSKAKDMGLKIAKDALHKNNNFLSTVKSGSKGDFFNIAQITGLLGQQSLSGNRVIPTLNNGTRTLPHYSFDNLNMAEEYESKGFIDSSFIKGLNPKQYYFHSMSGRESTCDTAMNTATSGYIQRRIIKLIEDIKIQYDGSVRDCCGSIYQWAYGENFLDPKALVKVGKELEFCDVQNIVNKLNLKFELKSKI